jgi:hypothetical protein
VKGISIGGVMGSVLAIRPKIRGFKPGQSDEFIRTIKSAARLSSEGEVKLSAPCLKILRRVKDPCGV